uniref:Uncharacterized protein n=1 Tax=Arundo donax TaxID=35708 RepID=A0A0A9D734_ARUDO
MLHPRSSPCCADYCFVTGRSPSPHNLQHNTRAIKNFLSRFPTAAGAGTSWT